MTPRKTFDLGATERGSTLALPNELATEAVAVFGRRGSGKSNTLTVCMEGLMSNGYQVVLIDPKGEGWGLRRPGSHKVTFPVVVLGEPHGDLPLDEHHGATVADAVVDSGQSFVLSLAGFPSKASDRRFVTAFCERLYRRKMQQTVKTPLAVVIEEAGLFVPQRIPSGGEALVGAIQQLVRQGRAFGIGVYLADQRPASVNTDVRTQMEVLICHQVSGAHDRKALREWVEAQADDSMLKEFFEHIAALQPGEAFIWSPAALRLFERVTVRRRWTYDSGATPTQQKSNPPGEASTIDLDALRTQMSEAVEQAKANDPRELRKRIVELERELETNLKQTTPVSAAPEDIEDQLAAEYKQGAAAGYADGWADCAEQYGAAVESERDRFTQAIGDAMQAVEFVVPTVTRDARAESREIIRNFIHEPAPRSQKADLPPRMTQQVSSTPKSARASSNGDGKLGKGEATILTAIAQHRAGVDREQLTVLTGYKRSSRDTYLQRLSAGGYIDTGGGAITVTDQGVAALGSDYQPLPTGARLQEYWLDRLSGGEEAILRVLIRAYPSAVDRDAISEETGYKRSSRDTYIQRLSARKLVTSTREGVTASDTLFDRRGR